VTVSTSSAAWWSAWSSTTWPSTPPKNYTLLAIGDGLVAQIPSLIISTAAGVVVARGQRPGRAAS
jgi:type III secretory pathway component EscV